MRPSPKGALRLLPAVAGVLVAACAAGGGVGADADAGPRDLSIVGPDQPVDAVADTGPADLTADDPDAAGGDADTPDDGPAPDAPADAIDLGPDVPEGTPVVTEVLPRDGLATVPAEGVVVRGRGFGTGATLTFVDVTVPVSDCDYAGVPERIVCRVPARGAGPARGEVRVTNRDGATGALPDAWTYTAVVTEVDFCNVQFPRNMTVADGNPAVVGQPREVYSQIYEPGLTTLHAGPAPGILGQLGLSPRDPVGADLDPTRSNRWRYVAAGPNPGFMGFTGNNDEYVATLVPEQVGRFRYVYRYSLDEGLSFTYCDRDDAQAGFDPAQVSELDVLAP